MGNHIAIITFGLVVAFTIGLTIWAACRTKSSDNFFTAGGNIGGFQNGLAISAEFTSAASLLGVVALFYGFGGDILIFLISSVAGFAFVLFVMAERYRELGKFTLADVISSRFQGKSLRLFAAISTLVVVGFYLIAQMVGAGKLIELLFGVSYGQALSIIGVLIFIYVTFGGMLATTWVQMFKAGMFLIGLTIICGLILSKADFSLTHLVNQAVNVHPKGNALMGPGLWLDGPVSAISLAAAMMFGVAGLPHILIRFCTVKDPATARTSMWIATLIIAVVAVMYIFLGFGAIAYVMDNPAYFADGKMLGGGNMAFLHLSHAIGGNLMFGIVCAIVYATILAVVAGLVITAVSAISHDLYATIIKDGDVEDRKALNVSRIASGSVALMTVLLGLAFEDQNIGYMASLAFAVAASANFPVLILVLHWSGLTARGALAGGYTGLVFSVLFVVLGPTVSVELLGFDQPLFPWREPAMFAMFASFFVCWIVSVTDKTQVVNLAE